MINVVCTPPFLRITLTVAMETVHFFIVQLSFSLRTKNLCISWVPINDLAPMKSCLGGCKVGQISSRCTMHSFTLYAYFVVMCSYFQCYAPCKRYFYAKIAFIITRTIGKIHPFKNSEKLEIKFYLTSIV